MIFMLLPRLAAIATLLVPSVRAVVIDFVPVGNPGNPADPTTGYGAVSYGYQIGTYEVTNSQYAEFLNAVAKTDTHLTYDTAMSSSHGGIYRSGIAGNYSYTVKSNMGNKPVLFVSWHDAARFTNWLHNGQPTGLQTTATTEGGAYTLNGFFGTVIKNSTATVWIPTEDEWYKAAYYDPTPGASGDNYWLYPTSSDSRPDIDATNSVGDIVNPGANVANYSPGGGWNGLNSHVTTVGSAASASYYGTFDQGGNAFELNDSLVRLAFADVWARGLRGGSHYSTRETDLSSAFRLSNGPNSASDYQGFRVAGVPEPETAMFLVISSSLMLLRRKQVGVSQA